MLNKMKKVAIPSLAALIISGAATGAVFTCASNNTTSGQQKVSDKLDGFVEKKWNTEEKKINISLEKAYGFVKKEKLEDAAALFEGEANEKQGSIQHIKN